MVTPDMVGEICNRKISCWESFCSLTKCQIKIDMNFLKAGS